MNCKDRFVGCHGSCEVYLKEKAKLEKAREKKKEYNSSAGWDGYLRIKERNRR
jgi:hypothetical protein